MSKIFNSGDDFGPPPDMRDSFESGTMSDEDAQKNINSGIKLKQSKLYQSQRFLRDEFEEKVRNVSDRLQGNLKTAAELGIEFIKLMSDTRISENIGPYDRSFEKEVMRKLINYAININNDEQEKEGMGSVSLITLQLKTMFKMRDHINKISYENKKLERRVAALEKSIMSSMSGAADESK